MSEPVFEERRVSHRFAVNMTPVKYLQAHFNKINNAQIKDISTKGMGLITHEELATDMPLDIWLAMPDNGEKIHTVGEVIWCSRINIDRYRTGINFKESGLNLKLFVLRSIQNKDDI